MTDRPVHDEMVARITETFMKLVQISIIAGNPSRMRLIVDQCDIPPEDRMSVLDALALQTDKLEQQLKEQVALFATLQRQSS